MHTRYDRMPAQHARAMLPGCHGIESCTRRDEGEISVESERSEPGRLADTAAAAGRAPAQFRGEAKRV